MPGHASVTWVCRMCIPQILFILTTKIPVMNEWIRLTYTNWIIEKSCSWSTSEADFFPLLFSLSLYDKGMNAKGGPSEQIYLDEILSFYSPWKVTMWDYQNCKKKIWSLQTTFFKRLSSILNISPIFRKIQQFGFIVWYQVETYLPTSQLLPRWSLEMAPLLHIWAFESANQGRTVRSHFLSATHHCWVDSGICEGLNFQRIA